jgi:hypothetical protein
MSALNSLTPIIGLLVYSLKMEDQSWIIDNEIRQVQHINDCLRSNLQQNKRERLRKCRDADILDHWRRQQRNKTKHQPRTKMITLSTIMVPPHVSVDDPFSSQYSRYSSSERYGLYAAPENFKEKQPATRSDTPVQCQPQEFAAHTDFKYDHEFHNDYSQHFVDSGQRPQNYIRSTSLATRFNE